MDNILLEGIVIRRIHYNESSEIVHIFTPSGIVSVLVKGARKYKNNKLLFCEPITKVKCFITNRSLPTLVDYTIIDHFEDIKNDLKKNLWISYLFEIINKLNNADYNKNIYRFLNKILFLAKTHNVILLVLMAQIKLLKAFGVEPNWNSCVKCGSKDLKYFSISSGGFLCGNHKTSDSEDIGPYLIMKKLYYFDIYKSDFEMIEHYDVKLIYKFINRYYDYYIDINFHSKQSLIF